MTHLEQVDRRQRQRGRMLLPLIAGLALLLVLVGAGVTWLLMRDPAATPAVTAAVATASTSAVIVSTAPVVAPTSAAVIADPGELACARLDVKSTDWKALMALGEQAAKGTDEDVVFYGKQLQSYADIAVHAQGQSDEAKTEASAAKAAGRLRDACLKAGYRGAA